METKKSIIQKLEKERKKLRANGVNKIGIFGSFLKGKENKNSDVDILVSFDREDFGEKYFELLFLLEDLLKRKIDLIPIESLRKELQYVKQEAEYVSL
jgi:predicted nucleotidyltransferase